MVQSPTSLLQSEAYRTFQGREASKWVASKTLPQIGLFVCADRREAHHKTETHNLGAERRAQEKSGFCFQLSLALLSSWCKYSKTAQTPCVRTEE